MSDELGSIEKPASLLPEAVYDLLARVVPGAVLLYFLFPDIYKPGVNDEWGFLTLKALVLGYLIGLFLDVLIEGVVGPIRDGRFACLKCWHDVPQLHNWVVRQGDAYHRALAVKMHAEKMLFRSMAVVFLVVLLLNLICIAVGASKCLVSGSDVPWQGVLFMLVCSVLCFIKQRSSLASWQDHCDGVSSKRSATCSETSSNGTAT